MLELSILAAQLLRAEGVNLGFPADSERSYPAHQVSFHMFKKQSPSKRDRLYSVFLANPSLLLASQYS